MIDQLIANLDVIVSVLVTVASVLFGIKIASDRVLKYLSKSEDVAEAIEYAAGKADEVIEKTKEQLKNHKEDE